MKGKQPSQGSNRKGHMSETISSRLIQSLLLNTISTSARQRKYPEIIREGVTNFNQTAIHQIIRSHIMRQEEDAPNLRGMSKYKDIEEDRQNSTKWKADIGQKKIPYKSNRIRGERSRNDKKSTTYFRNSSSKESPRLSGKDMLISALQRKSYRLVLRSSDRSPTLMQSPSMASLTSRALRNKKTSKTMKILESEEEWTKQQSNEFVPLEDPNRGELYETIMEDQFHRQYIMRRNKLRSLLKEKSVDNSAVQTFQSSPNQGPKFTTQYNGQILPFGIEMFLRRKRRKGKITYRLNSKMRNIQSESQEGEKKVNQFKPEEKIRLQHNVKEKPKEKHIDLSCEEYYCEETAKTIDDSDGLKESEKQNYTHLTKSVREYFRTKHKKNVLTTTLKGSCLQGLNLNSKSFASIYREFPQFVLDNDQYEKDMKALHLASGVTWLNGISQRHGSKKAIKQNLSEIISPENALKVVSNFNKRESDLLAARVARSSLNSEHSQDSEVNDLKTSKRFFKSSPFKSKKKVQIAALVETFE